MAIFKIVTTDENGNPANYAEEKDIYKLVNYVCKGSVAVYPQYLHLVGRKDDIPLVELVLRIITGKKDLVITEFQTQKDMKRLVGARSICLDAYGSDSSGKKYDMEIQRADKGAGPYRARYHSSVMDIENLDAGQEFDELPDTYTIFITEKDFYGKGEALYPIERMNLVTGKMFNDGEHILYVNGEYRGDSELGKLMHDFNCTDADDMNYKLLADKTRYLKENPEGVEFMCRSMEEMRNDTAIRASIATYRECDIADKTIVERIMVRFNLTLEKATEYVAEKILI